MTSGKQEFLYMNEFNFAHMKLAIQIQVRLLTKLVVIIKNINFFCTYQNFIYRFASMKRMRIYNWSWRSSSVEAV
jgi:hypothetical protein